MNNLDETGVPDYNVQPAIAAGDGEAGSTQSSSGVDFAYALHGIYEGDFTFTHNGVTVRSRDSDYISQNDGALYLRPADADQIFFLYAYQPDSKPDAWGDCAVTPTTALWHEGEGDGEMLLCWALENPVKRDAIPPGLLEVFSMSLDQAIPLPDVDGWAMVHCDPDTFTTADELAATYLDVTEEEATAEPDTQQMYGQAVVKTPYDEDAVKDRQITVAIGAKKDSTMWQPQKLPLAQFMHRLTKHEVGRKDGLGVVLADMIPGPRLKTAVVSVQGIGLDNDNGTPEEEIDSKLADGGFLAVRYTTHSHGKTSTEFKEDAVIRWCKSEGLDFENITTGTMRRFVKEKKEWHNAVADTVEYKDTLQKSEGVMVIVSHAPISKNRIIVPLADPYVIADEGDTQAEALAKWASYPKALAKMLGLQFDKSCVDPARLYYLGRHAEGRDFGVSLFGGPLLQKAQLPLDPVIAESTKGKSSSATPEGRALAMWWVHFGHRFQGLDVIETLTDRKRDGKNLECAFDDIHSNPGDPSDQACFAKNADGGEDYCLFKCMHDSCADKTTLDHIAKLVKDGVIPASVLTDIEYNPAFEERDDNIDAKTLAEIQKRIDGIGKQADDSSARDGDSAEPQAELMPTLAELKDRIALLKKDETLDDWNRDDWFPVLVAIEEARLNVTDRDKAHETLRAHCDIKKVVYKDEVSDFKRDKKKQNNEAKQAPKEPDAKTIAKSDRIAALLRDAFGTTFHTPTSQLGNELHLDYFDGRPWFVSGAENTPICTPFVYDGARVYADRKHVRALRVRVYNADNKVVQVEFDAKLLGQLAGNELIGELYANGWVGDGPGRDFVLKHLRTKQLPGPTVYHKPGLRDGVFVLATGDIIAPEGKSAANIELHADSLVKGTIRAGTLDAGKEAAAKVFADPDAWHFQLGYLLGSMGPLRGYLDLLSLLVFFWGETRHGKTASELAAAAKYAEAVEGKELGYVANAHGTPNSHENTMEKAAGAVLIMDEFGKLPPKEQAEFAFRVAGQLGKRRQLREGGQRVTKSWPALCVIVSAERSLGKILEAANETFDSGMTARMIPVNFNGTKKIYGASWEAVEAMRKDHYGHSGPAFIRHMLSCDKQELKVRLAEIVKTLTSEGQGNLRYTAAENVACIQLVAELEAKAGLIPENYDAAPMVKKIWEEFLASDTAPIDPAERDLETLLTNLSQKRNREIVSYDNKDDQRSAELMGFHSVPAPDNSKRTGQDMPRRYYYYVIFSKYLGKLSGGRADETALKKLLEERGFLVRPKDKTGKKMTWPKFPELSVGPYIVIRAELVDGPEEDDAATDRPMVFADLFGAVDGSEGKI